MRSPETLYREFRATLHRYLARRLANPADVEDVLQEVFVRVARNADTLRDIKKPLAWLYTLTNSAISDHARKKRRNPLAHAKEINESAQPWLPEQSDGDFESCLMPLLNTLPDNYRDAVMFVDMAEGKQTEYASKFRLSVPAAKSRVQRGRRLLKEAILGCCDVERDGRQNVTSLGSGKCRQEACC